MSYGKEMSIRRRVAETYNRRREDYVSDRDYNDYLEEVEDIVFSLSEGAPDARRATEAKLVAYARANAAAIAAGQARAADEAMGRSRAGAGAAPACGGIGLTAGAPPVGKPGLESGLESMFRGPGGAAAAVPVHVPRRLQPAAPPPGGRPPPDAAAVAAAGGWLPGLSESRAAYDAVTALLR